MLRRRPEAKLSIQVTDQPSDSSRWDRWEPIKPAPPVISALTLSTILTFVFFRQRKTQPEHKSEVHEEVAVVDGAVHQHVDDGPGGARGEPVAMASDFLHEDGDEPAEGQQAEHSELQPEVEEPVVRVRQV